MAVVKWMFLDTATLDTYTFEVNPSKPISPDFVKTLTATNVGAGDTTIITEKDAVQQIAFSGTILTQTEYEAFVAWWMKEVPITVTDDLGRTFTLVIKDFLPKRERALDYPWKHAYDVTGIATTATSHVASAAFSFSTGPRT